MAISYNPLWKQLIDKNLKKTELIRMAGLTNNVLARMSKGEYISMLSIDKICCVLNCQPNDIFCVLNRNIDNGEKEYGVQ